jgi:hypothetical protein
MDLADIRFPRELEADGSAETIRTVLGVRMAQLWPGGDLSAPMITMGEPLKKVLRKASLNGQVRMGLEVISHKLQEEERGLANLREDRGLSTGNRVSRLLLVSNDGAQRFYRHIEDLLKAHTPRLFGCMLDMDGHALGSLVTGKEKQVKAIIAEHKVAVAGILRAIAIG